jgi:hypothetical protein
MALTYRERQQRKEEEFAATLTVLQPEDVAGMPKAFYEYDTGVFHFS